MGPHALPLLAGLYVAFIGRIALKDFRDVEGDERYGKRTFLVRRGRAETCALSAICWILGSAVIVTIAPLRSLLVVVFVLYVACALHGLRLLARTRSFVSEQVIIGAIANVGRGVCITVLAYFTMASKGWSTGRQDLVYFSLAFLFVGMYRATIAERGKVTLEAVRPF